MLIFRLGSLKNKKYFFKVLSKKMKLKIEYIEILYKSFGEDFFYFLSLLEGKRINFLSVNMLNNIKSLAECKEELDGKSLEFKKGFLKKRFRLDDDKILKIIEEYEL